MTPDMDPKICHFGGPFWMAQLQSSHRLEDLPYCLLDKGA